MNYFALAGAIITGLYALTATALIFRVTLGHAHWKSGLSFYAQAAYVAGFGTLSVWLFSITF